MALKQDSSSNGSGDEFDNKLVGELRKKIERVQLRVTELTTELDEVKPELRRYERALDLMTGTATMPGPKPAGLKPVGRPKGSGKRVRENPSGMSPERLGRIEAAIDAYSEDHDEFRQVDIRREMSGYASGPMAMAFELMRRRSVIRVARVDGNSKYYRLTRETLRERQA